MVNTYESCGGGGTGNFVSNLLISSIMK